MTRKFTFLILALLALISGPGWGQATVTISTFTETSGNIGNNNIITYVAYKGNGTTAPAISSGTLRIYKPSSGSSTGGYVTISAKEGYLMNSVTITNSNDKAGTIKYNIDGGDLSSDISLPKSATYTIDDIEATSVNFYNCGSDRLSIGGFSVIYNSTSTDPNINAGDEVNLAYDATSGSIPYTISNPVDGVELEASLEEGATWITELTVGDESITFNTTANDSYDSRSAEITLSYEGATNKFVTVTQSGRPIPTITADNVTIEQDATSGMIEYTITNPIEGQNLTAEITTGDWISNLAVDAGNSKVTFDAAVNTGAARTATIRLKYTGAIDKVVTVTQKKFAVDYATLPFNWAGGGKSGLLALDGVTANGLGDDYAESHASYRIKFDGTGDYIQIKTNEAIGTITIGVKMIGGATASSITIQGSADGEEFTSTETLSISGKQNDIVNLETLNAIDASYRYVRLYFTKGSNVGVGPITIAKAETAYTVGIAQVIENGSISVSPTSAIAGRTITIVPTPIDGYVLDHYTISKTEDGTDVTGSVDLDGNTFTMPAYDVTVSATFTPALSYTVTIANIQHGTVNSVENEYFEGATVQLTVEPDPNYGLVSLTITKTEGGSVTGIEPVLNAGNGKYEFTMPAYDITVSASFGKIATYTRITSIDQLIVGRPYIIVGKKVDKYYTMDAQATNNRSAIEIDADETTARWFESDILHEFFISGDADNRYSISNLLCQGPINYSESQGFLYAASKSDNHLKTKETLDGNGKWTIGFDETGAASIVAQGENTHNVMQFNSSSTLFSCYTSSSQSPVYLYMKDNPYVYGIYSDTYIDGDISNCLFFSVNKGAALTVTGTIDANIMMFSIVDGSQLIYDNDIPNGTIGNRFRKYADDEADQRTAWNLVSVPINNFNLLPKSGISISGDYDLYSYSEPTHFWKNKKNEAILYEGSYYIPTAIGTGYLFSMPSSNTTGRFGGMGTLQGSGQDLSFPLSYTETLADGKPNVLKGFNLVGNPFTCNAYVNMDYLVLNETGSNFVNPTSPIKPGDAILVQATEEHQQITFTRNAPTEPENRLDISISQNRGSIIDNARIRFGEGRGMNKFYLNENSTRLYIPQNGKDYAVVMASAAEGEMLVNFKAEKNGSYTITVNTENIDAEYLHLIDNKTGMDVDLLASTGSASYTFEAKASDYASRFKLVFSMTGVEENASTSSVDFAYMSNGNLVIDNIEGEATLQIVDELGRIISTETVSGSYNKALNLKAGLYIINLNGMTQKIVVE